ESLEDGAMRILEAKTSVQKAYLEQLYTFGDVERDPRWRVITVAYFSLIRRPRREPKSQSGAEAAWFPAHNPPPLAFDHERILQAALERLRNKIRYEPIGFE